MTTVYERVTLKAYIHANEGLLTVLSVDLRVSRCSFIAQTLYAGEVDSS